MKRVLFKIFIALIISIVIGIVVIASWFLVFGPHGLPELAQEISSIPEKAEFWLGVGIFSLVFFFLFVLPITLLFGNE